ncbi:hypothetical protein D3C71_1902550 [compost metagenome]
MAGGHAMANARLVRQHGDGFDEARLLIVDLIAVDIQRAVIFFRQREGDVQGLHAVLAGKFKVRDRPDHIGPQF